MTTDDALEHRLKRLMALRVVMITTVLLIAAYLEAVSENLLPVNPLYFLIGCTYLLTLGHSLALRHFRNPVPLVYAQVLGDLAVITGLVMVTGGGRSGFMLLYPISVLSGSVLLDRRGAVVFSTVAVVFYTAGTGVVASGWVRPPGIAEPVRLARNTHALSVLITGVACVTVGFVGSYLSESLRRTGARLEEAFEQVADLQHLNNVIVNSMHSGLLTTDASGRVLHVNEFGEGILGRRVAEIRGRSIREVFGSWLLDLPAVQARASDRRLARLEIPYRRPDGRPLDLGLSVSPLAAGAPRGHLLVFQDLTDVKRLEGEFRIKEKLAAVGEMAAQLAHEIRNPLGSISGSAQILLAEADVSAEQERLLSIITRESRRLSDTLNQFLFQARPAPAPPGPVDLRPVIAEAVTLLRNGPEVQSGHRIEFQSDDGPHLCFADRDRIAQVFWNLARNGLEAMPGGGTLQIRLLRAGSEIVLLFRDQGRGMGAEEQRRIFEPFRSQTPTGTGLGLAIVYRIVQEHHGDIAVRSVPSLGTEVEVRLPRVALPVTA